VARLATVDGAAHPSVVPICYAGDGRAIYSALDEKPKRVPPTRLKRVRNLLERPDVALVVDDYDEDWSRLAHLIVRGRAGLLAPGEDGHVAGVALLRARYPQYRAMAIEAQPLIVVRPVSARFWSAAAQDNRRKR
jgi:PPOX class probable F420-dependent enzyme